MIWHPWQNQRAIRNAFPGPHPVRSLRQLNRVTSSCVEGHADLISALKRNPAHALRFRRPDGRKPDWDDSVPMTRPGGLRVGVSCSGSFNAAFA
jgi:hypothetical protein